MFLRYETVAILVVLFLLAVATADKETHSTEPIVNKSNNNATTHLDSSTLPIGVSSVDISSDTIETVKLEEYTLPNNITSPEISTLPAISTFPIEAISHESSTYSATPANTENSTVTVETTNPESSTIQVGTTTQGSSTVPAEAVSDITRSSTQTSTEADTSTAPIVTSTTQKSVCRDGWVERDGFGACYFVSTDAVVWLDARNTCHNLVASLVSIHTEDENCFVRSLVNNESDYWIGLTADSLRHNRWTDESVVAWTNWQNPAVQPFGSWCGLLLAGQPSAGAKWKQSVCLFNKHFVCKKVLYGQTRDREDRTWLCTSVVAASALLLVVGALTGLVVARRRRQTDVRLPPPSVTDIRAVATHSGSRQFADGRLSDELSLSFECRYAWSSENIYSTVDEDIASYGYEHLGHRTRTENIYEPTYSNLCPDYRGSGAGGKQLFC